MVPFLCLLLFHVVDISFVLPISLYLPIDPFIPQVAEMMPNQEKWIKHVLLSSVLQPLKKKTHHIAKAYTKLGHFLRCRISYRKLVLIG